MAIAAGELPNTATPYLASVRHCRLEGADIAVPYAAATFPLFLCNCN
ncbi:hypothetical protein OROGR_018176 [Orobanche gracilis]